MAQHIAGTDRSQENMLPARVEDYVGLQELVRVIDAFVGRLSLVELGFERARPAATGRPGYDPGDLLRLFLYGYCQGVRSSRRLERECRINLEVKWLLRDLVPDHKTIAVFRRQTAALVKAGAAFVRLCRAHGVLNEPEVAIDGSKIQAAAGRRKVLTEKGTKKKQEDIEARIEAYVKRLAEMDAKEADEPGDDVRRQRVKDVLDALEKRKAVLLVEAGQLAASGLTALVTTEADARAMRLSDKSSAPAYNVQIAVSTETHLIVHHEVVQDRNDRQQLYPMALASMEALDIEPGQAAAPVLPVLADSGYSNGEQAALCEAAGIVPSVPPQRSVNPKGHFPVSAFTYDPQSDSFTCPAGQILPLKQTSKDDKTFKYQAHDCRQCPLKSKCTEADRRTVSRSWFEAELARMAKRTADPAPMQRRRCTAEHPFGTIKAVNGARFLVKGLKKVRAEAALQVLAFNLRRFHSLIGQANACTTLA